MENEDTLAVQSLLSRDHTNYGGGGGGGMWERGEKKEKDWERERERAVNRVSEQGLVPLDVAALTHNSPLLHVLTKAGARHNPACESYVLKYLQQHKNCVGNAVSTVWCKSYSDSALSLALSVFHHCVFSQCANQQSGRLSWMLWWHWQVKR